MKLLLLFSMAVALSQALVGKVCQHESDCDAGECCQILNPFPVMSKRQLALVQPTAGTCQLYRKLGAHCGVFEKANGYCSCEPGTQCHGWEVKIENVQHVGRRSMIAPHPGYTWVYNCSLPATATP